MKNFVLTLSLFVIMVSLFSCSKSNSTTTPVNPNPIVGLWVGTTLAANEPYAGNLYYSYDVRADSSVLVQALGADGNTYYASGKWTMTDSSFSAVITSNNLSNKGVVQDVTATYSSSKGTLAGQWQNEVTYGAASGVFTLNRVD